MSIHNYELIHALDKEKNTNSRIFKVKEKSSGRYYVWYVIDSQYLSNQDRATIEEKFRVRKTLEHPNLLGFHELIQDVESNLLYLVVHYCRYGSVEDILDIALRDSSRVCEEFLCRIIYQIALVIKANHTIVNLNIADIFFDEEYNVKLFNFDLGATIKSKNPKTSVLGIMLFEICTLTKFKKNSFEKQLKNYSNIYSKGFLSLVTDLIKDNGDLKKTIDKILCNSTLLLKSTQWYKKKLLIKIDDTNNHLQIAERNEGSHSLFSEKMREKELHLQIKEKELKEREYKLACKEKKIALLEKKLKENLKKINNLEKTNNTSNCNCNKGSNGKDNLDSTYVSCGDSVIIPTSKKLDTNEIIKPATFTRTLSEKRIKFKGHSPLKDRSCNRRSVRYPKTSKPANSINKNTEWLTCSDDTDKSSLTYQQVAPKNNGKPLFRTYENNFGDLLYNGDAKPKQWTEENKRNAFELLRIMNNEKENQPPNVKHTYL